MVTPTESVSSEDIENLVGNGRVAQALLYYWGKNPRRIQAFLRSSMSDSRGRLQEETLNSYSEIIQQYARDFSDHFRDNPDDLTISFANIISRIENVIENSEDREVGRVMTYLTMAKSVEGLKKNLEERQRQLRETQGELDDESIRTLITTSLNAYSQIVETEISEIESYINFREGGIQERSDTTPKSQVGRKIKGALKTAAKTVLDPLYDHTIGKLEPFLFSEDEVSREVREQSEHISENKEKIRSYTKIKKILSKMSNEEEFSRLGKYSKYILELKENSSEFIKGGLSQVVYGLSVDEILETVSESPESLVEFTYQKINEKNSENVMSVKEQLEYLTDRKLEELKDESIQVGKRPKGRNYIDKNWVGFVGSALSGKKTNDEIEKGLRDVLREIVNKAERKNISTDYLDDLDAINKPQDEEYRTNLKEIYQNITKTVSESNLYSENLESGINAATKMTVYSWIPFFGQAYTGYKLIKAGLGELKRKILDEPSNQDLLKFKNTASILYNELNSRAS